MLKPSIPPPAYSAFRKARIILADVQKPLTLAEVPALLARARERLAAIPRKVKR